MWRAWAKCCAYNAAGKIEACAAHLAWYRNLPDMPAPKIEQSASDNKQLKLIDYSSMTVRVVDKKDPTIFNSQKIDATPSQPPWTTWSGILEARRDSPVGKRILATDPNAIDGETASEEQLKKMHNRPDAAKKEWVRGIWIAPEDWKEIEAF